MAQDTTTYKSEHRLNRMLDQAVEDSFPASDPVSLAMPHDYDEHRPVFRWASAAPLLVIAAVVGAVAFARRRT